jgi:hypothetical protein
MPDHKLWIAVSIATQRPINISLLTYVCVIQVTIHINAQDSGDVFDVLQDCLDQRQEACLVVPYAEMIYQRLFDLSFTPDGSIHDSMETAQQRVQVAWTQRKIPHDQFYDLTEPGMNNSELLARFLGLCLVAEEHFEWPDLVLMVLQRRYTQRHDGQRDADYLNTCQHHVDGYDTLTGFLVDEQVDYSNIRGSLGGVMKKWIVRLTCISLKAMSQPPPYGGT